MFSTPITLGRLIWWLILGSLMPIILLVALFCLGFAYGALSDFLGWAGHHIFIVGFVLAVAFEAARRNVPSNAEPTDA